MTFDNAGVAMNKAAYDAIVSGTELSLTNQRDGGSFNSENGEYDFSEGQEMHLVVDMEAFKDSEQFNDGYSPNERMVNIVTHESKHTIQLYFDPGPEYKKELGYQAKSLII